MTERFDREQVEQKPTEQQPDGSSTSTGTGENGSDSSDAKSWTEAMKQRLCLLVYKSDADEDETEVFHRDAQAMQTLLIDGPIRPTSEKNIKLMELTEFNDSHLEYITKTESAIFETLRNRNLPDLPKDEKEFKMMTYGVYSGIRVLKARENFISSVKFKERFRQHGEAYLSTYIERIAKLAFERWTYWTHHTIAWDSTDSEKATLLTDFMKLRPLVSTSNTCAENTRDSDNNEQKDQVAFLEEHEKKISKMEAKFNTYEKGTARKHVRKMFAMSVYSSGFFPSSCFQDKRQYRLCSYQSTLKKWFHKHLKTRFKGLKKVELENNSEDTKNARFELLLKYLPECVAQSKQWLWLHFSGHNGDASNLSPELPSRELELFYKLSLDLFSNVVLSLDCCFPDAPRRVSDSHAIALLPCASNMRALYPEGGSLSNFTNVLIRALNGFPPKECSNSLKTEGNACSICTKLSKDVREKKFIFQQHVREFFEGHSKTCKVRCDSEYHFPLLSVRNASSTEDAPQCAAENQQ